MGAEQARRWGIMQELEHQRAPGWLCDGQQKRGCNVGAVAVRGCTRQPGTHAKRVKERGRKNTQGC